MDNKKIPGPTGKFPDGKLNKFDEGGLNIGVAADPKKGVVIVNFNTPVTWFAMKPDQAITIGKGIIKNAKKLIKKGVRQ